MSSLNTGSPAGVPVDTLQRAAALQVRPPMSPSREEKRGALSLAWASISSDPGARMSVRACSLMLALTMRAPAGMRTSRKCSPICWAAPSVATVSSAASPRRMAPSRCTASSLPSTIEMAIASFEQYDSLATESGS